MTSEARLDEHAPRDLWALEDGLVFLNHGSFGACPKSVLAEQDVWRARMEADPMRFFLHRLPDALDYARTRLADLIGARPRDIAFVQNATTAVNAVLRSFPWRRGDAVVVGDQAYNACRNALEFTAEREGLEIRVAPLPFPCDGPDVIVEAYLTAVGEGARLALLDHVTSPTGMRLPIESLVTALQARDVECLVDGAHGPGMIALDLGALGAEYYTGNAHKWLGAPKGSAFLHVREDRQATVRPTTISHGANLPSPERSRFLTEFDWVGTIDPTPWICLPAALDAMDGLHPDGIEGRMRANRDLALSIRPTLADALDIDLPCPDSMIATLAAFPLPVAPDGGGPNPLAPSPLQRALYERERIQVPIFPWPAPPARLIRVSCERYNRPEEYDVLANALRALDPRTL